MENSRRKFIKTSATGTTAVLAGGILPGFSAKSYGRIIGANRKVNVGVAGFHNRGIGHIRTFASLEGVSVSALCDIDQRLFPKGIQEVEGKGGGLLFSAPVPTSGTSPTAPSQKVSIGICSSGQHPTARSMKTVFNTSGTGFGIPAQQNLVITLPTG